MKKNIICPSCIGTGILLNLRSNRKRGPQRKCEICNGEGLVCNQKHDAFINQIIRNDEISTNL